jgi:hypothetical protein
VLDKLKDRLLLLAAVLLLGNTVFAAAAGLVWPRHYLLWVSRVSSAVFLAAAVAACVVTTGYWRDYLKRDPR